MQSVLPNDLQLHTRTAGGSVIVTLLTACTCPTLPKLVQVMSNVLAFRVALVSTHGLDQPARVLVCSYHHFACGGKQNVHCRKAQLFW